MFGRRRLGGTVASLMAPYAYIYHDSETRRIDDALSTVDNAASVHSCPPSLRSPDRRPHLGKIAMVLRFGLVASALAALLVGAHALTPNGRIHANFAPRPSVPKVSAPTVEEAGPVTSRNGTTLPPYNTTYYFDQLIDHTNPSLGTFKQRYWHTYEFYETGMILLVPIRFGSLT